MTIDKLTMSTKWYYNIARGNNIKQGKKMNVSSPMILLLMSFLLVDLKHISGTARLNEGKMREVVY